tara:strand:+ start:1099 stop:1419 length:321 start_codon:yes stop_codon:yes gene_type:complete
MKKLMTILLMTATFSSAHALWSGPISSLRPIIKETPTMLKELSIKKICGIIKTTGLAKRPFIEADRGDIVGITGLKPKSSYAKGCAYGKVTTKNYGRKIHVSRYEF